MTVISAIRFNNNSGAISSDEQGSYHIRKTDIVSKLTTVPVNIPLIIGGSGASNVLYEIKKRVIKSAANTEFPKKDTNEILRAVSQIINNTREDFVNSILNASYHIDLIDFQRGYRVLKNGTSIQLNSEVMKDAHNIVSGRGQTQQLLSNSFLCLMKESEKPEIYVLDMSCNKPYVSARPYEVIGSGADMADIVLSDFFRVYKDDERDNVNENDGMAALLYSTWKASVVNIGVGGAPQLKYIKGNKIIKPSEDCRRLATEIVVSERAGYIDRSLRKTALEELVFKEGGNDSTVEDELWNHVSDKRLCSRHLRGYRNNKIE